MVRDWAAAIPVARINRKRIVMNRENLMECLLGSPSDVSQRRVGTQGIRLRCGTSSRTSGARSAMRRDESRRGRHECLRHIMLLVLAAAAGPAFAADAPDAGKLIE